MSDRSLHIEVRALVDWAAAIKKFTDQLKGNEILLLQGSLGAGKTTFVQSLVQNYFKESGAVASPTFALHHQYQKDSKIIDHWDLYRVEDLSELDAAGFWELLNFGQSIFVVEWPDRISHSDWPVGRPIYKISIEVQPETSRLVQARRIEIHRL